VEFDVELAAPAVAIVDLILGSGHD
jgi:hypothetical protein